MHTRPSRILSSLIAVAALAVVLPATAGGGVSWSVGIGGGFPAYYPPPPVYYSPPPVYNNNYSNYYAPPVIYGSAPVYSAPPPIIVYDRSYYRWRPPHDHDHGHRGGYQRGHRDYRDYRR